MKILIHWQPELPTLGSSCYDEDGLRTFFGDAETRRILDALAAANGGPVTLTVNGPDAGYLNLEPFDAEFRVVQPSSAHS